jgi:hypothetical protein
MNKRVRGVSVQKRSSYSLVEVMLAVGILGAALPSVFSAFGSVFTSGIFATHHLRSSAIKISDNIYLDTS